MMTFNLTWMHVAYVLSVFGVCCVAGCLFCVMCMIICIIAVLMFRMLSFFLLLWPSGLKLRKKFN